MINNHYWLLLVLEVAKKPLHGYAITKEGLHGSPIALQRLVVMFLMKMIEDIDHALSAAALVRHRI